MLHIYLKQQRIFTLQMALEPQNLNPTKILLALYYHWKHWYDPVLLGRIKLINNFSFLPTLLFVAALVF